MDARADDILNMHTYIGLASGGWGAGTFMPIREEQQFAGELRSLEAQALAGVYDRYSVAVYKYVRYRLGDDRMAEDVASEVFLSLLESLQRGSGPRTNVKGWLLATAGHIVTDHLRRAYRRPTESLDDEHPDAGRSLDDEFDRRQRSRDFQRAYQQLTHEQQHVVALRFGEGLSLEETAAITGKNVNAVKALQFRALQAIQRNIGESPHE